MTIACIITLEKLNNVAIAFGTLSFFLAYLHIVGGVVCFVVLVAVDEKLQKCSCLSSVIGMRSYPISQSNNENIKSRSILTPLRVYFLGSFRNIQPL